MEKRLINIILTVIGIALFSVSVVTKHLVALVTLSTSIACFICLLELNGERVTKR